MCVCNITSIYIYYVLRCFCVCNITSMYMYYNHALCREESEEVEDEDCLDEDGLVLDDNVAGTR